MAKTLQQIAAVWEASLAVSTTALSPLAHAVPTSFPAGDEIVRTPGQPRVISRSESHTRQHCQRALNQATTQIYRPPESSSVGFIRKPGYACKIDLQTRAVTKTYDLKFEEGFRELSLDIKNPQQAHRQGLTPRESSTLYPPQGLSAREKCENASQQRQPLTYKFRLQHVGFLQGADYACKLDLKHYTLTEIYDLQTTQGRSKYQSAVSAADKDAIEAGAERYENATGRKPHWQRPPVSVNLLR